MHNEASRISQKLIDAKVKQELTNLLFAGAFRANVLIAVTSLALFICLRAVSSVYSLTLWVVSMVLLAGSRLSISYLFTKKVQSSQSQKMLLKLYIAMTAILGVAWSFLALLPHVFDSVYSQSFIILSMVEVLVIAVTVLAMNRSAQILYSAPFPLVISILLLSSPNPFSLQFSLFIVFFSCLWFGLDTSNMMLW